MYGASWSRKLSQGLFGDARTAVEGPGLLGDEYNVTSCEVRSCHSVSWDDDVMGYKGCHVFPLLVRFSFTRPGDHGGLHKGEGEGLVPQEGQRPRRLVSLVYNRWKRLSTGRGGQDTRMDNIPAKSRREGGGEGETGCSQLELSRNAFRIFLEFSPACM